MIIIFKFIIIQLIFTHVFVVNSNSNQTNKLKHVGQISKTTNNQIKSQA